MQLDNSFPLLLGGINSKINDSEKLKIAIGILNLAQKFSARN